MSVVSRNPFDLLGEGAESQPAVASQPKTAAPPKPAAASAREVPGSKPPRGRGGAEGAARGSRGGYYSRGGPRNVLKTDSSAAETSATDPEAGFEGERRAPSRGQGVPRGQGEGRGRGRATRTRGGRGGAAGGKDAGLSGAAGERRQDGRKSAHALPDSEKRVASGWGPEEGTAELTAEVEGAKDATEEAAVPQTPAVEVAPEAKTEQAPAVAEQKPEEEEDNTKSYEEYLAERAQAALHLNIGKLEGRKVEGTSELVGSALTKQQEEEWYSGANKEKAKAEKSKASSKKEKVFIEFEGKFPPPSTGERRGGRGGARGGDRGGDRGRGAPRNVGDRPFRGAGRGGRGGAQAAPAVAVNDKSAFPALGA